MARITIASACTPSTTTIPNSFLDYYMPAANGEFVKVYLCLQRMLGSTQQLWPSLEGIADFLSMTEGDVLRAIKYWENTGLLCVEYEKNSPVAIVVTDVDEVYRQKLASEQLLPTADSPTALPQADSYEPQESASDNACSLDDNAEPLPKKDYSSYTVRKFKKDDDFKQTLFVAEQLIGKELSSQEVSTLIYIYDELKFSHELIEYLIEYCVDKGKRSLRYIQKVAISWDEQGVRTIEQATKFHEIYSQRVYSIMKVYGLSDRQPAEAELKLITQWYDTYGFENDVIIEACNRTIQAIHRPSFEYTDGILKNWKARNVHSLSDIDVYDASRAQKSSPSVNQNSGQASRNIPKSKPNSFNNFNQRNYDFDQMEKDLIKKGDK